jgi:hypothetical protein
MEDLVPMTIVKTLAFLIFTVGGYVFMFLNVMRTDPREEIFREQHNENGALIPKKKKKG